MGRLTLHVLLSFAQFERKVTAERIRVQIAGSKKKGMWMGGFLVPDIVRDIFQGKQPVALTSDWLLRQTLPGDFDEQRDLIRSLR